MVVVCFDVVGETFGAFDKNWKAMLSLAFLGNFLSQISGYPAERHLGHIHKERPSLNIF